MILRPIRIDDGPLLERFHMRLSDESRYRRFHAAKPRLSATELRHLTEIDDRTHVAIVAEREDGELAAVARVIADQDGPAEVAVVVADDCRHKGTGGAVTTAALARFADRGPGGPVVAHVQADNRKALRLFRDRLGGVPGPVRDGIVSLHLAA